MFLLKRHIFKKVGKEIFPSQYILFTFLFHLFVYTYLYFFSFFRPWDTINDLYQYEKEHVICTKTKHKTPMIRTQSIVSVSEAASEAATKVCIVYSTLISRIFFVSINFYHMCNILISRPPLRLRAVLVTVQRPPDKLVTNPMMANYDRQWETPIWGLIPWLIILRSLIKVVISRPLYR